jgi:hypothetical protein
VRALEWSGRVKRMSEGDFWNNLDSFVEKQTSGQESEKVGDWLKTVPSIEEGKSPPKPAIKSKR